MDQQIIFNPIWPPRKQRGKTKVMILLTKGIKNEEIHRKKGVVHSF